MRVKGTKEVLEQTRYDGMVNNASEEGLGHYAFIAQIIKVSS